MKHNTQLSIRRGFSLIEVLIATTVLGLGTLGLIAIIAGSASQQRNASMQNLSVGVVKNADGLLSRMLGRTGLSLGTIPIGQWGGVVMDEESNYLTVAPGYMLVDFSDQSVVFDQGLQPGPASPAQLSAGLNVGFYSQANGSMFADAEFKRLKHRRIDLDSGLTVQVEILEYSPITGLLGNLQTITFVNPAFPSGSSDIQSLDYVNSFGSPFTGATMEFDTRENSFQGTGGIDSFSIPAMTNRIINRITVSPYQWRNDQLVSISDRFVYEPEESYPGGQRPILGYSALIRQSEASTQLCFFTYSLRALSLPQENESIRYRGLAFVPPDTRNEIDTNRGVLREVELLLGYEQQTQRYFLELPIDQEAELGWAIDQGQILMVSSLNGVVNNNPDPSDPGADFPVRVLTNRTISNDSNQRVIVGYLDRSPRIDGRTPLFDLATPGARQTVFAWAVQPVVSSRSDGTEWLLSVVDARVIQVATQ